MASRHENPLASIKDSDFTIAEGGTDVRGRDVLDASGEQIGEVDDLLVDHAEGQVRMLRVKHGGFLGIGADHFLVPVDAVTSVTADAVHIDREHARLTDVPGYDPTIEQDDSQFEEVYGWWGYPTYWSPGYSYPAVYKDLPPY